MEGENRRTDDPEPRAEPPHEASEHRDEFVSE
jgi:hypothetical protein